MLHREVAGFRSQPWREHRPLILGSREEVTEPSLPQGYKLPLLSFHKTKRYAGYIDVHRKKGRSSSLSKHRSHQSLQRAWRCTAQVLLLEGVVDPAAGGAVSRQSSVTASWGITGRASYKPCSRGHCDIKLKVVSCHNGRK